MIAGFMKGEDESTPILFKVDENGDSVWARQYNESQYASLNFVQQTSDGGYVATGVFGSSGHCIRVLKADSMGELTWSRRYSGFRGLCTYSSCIRETSGGGYIVVGGNTDPAGWRGMYLLRLDTNGDTIWTRTLYEVFGQSVQEASDGGFVVSGDAIYDGEYWYGGSYKFSYEGYTVWHRRYGKGVLNDIRLTDDGGYVMTGEEKRSYMWIVKTDGEGRAYDREVSPTEIISPEFSYEDFYWCIPSARFRNLGREDVSDFYCHCEIIGDLFSEFTPDYHDSILVEGPLIKGNSILVEFKKWMSYDTVGAWFTAEFYTTKPKDTEWGTVPKENSFKAAANPGVEEKDISSTPSCQYATTCGPQIIFRFSGYTQGFQASIYDVSGRRVDEIKSSSCSGMVTWGECYGPGVYFIVPRIGVESPRKVILIR